jgi:lysophospholipase L1-like esterase
VYGDDAFGGTSAPAYASGGYVSGGGFSGGGLRVLLGGVDDSAVVGMSGGWSRPFSLSTQTLVRVSLRYRLVFQGTYEGDECGRALVSVDGVALSPDGTGVLRQYCGADPQTGVVSDSGWQQAIIEVSLAAGSHTVKVGGLNTKKTRANEYTEVYFDDIELRQLNVEPQVVLAPQALSFSMVQGGGAATQVLQVDTSDAAAVAYTLSDDAGWLTVNPVLGQTPAAVTVAVNGAGLAVGTYNAVITASAGGYITGTCTISLSVTSNGVLFSDGFEDGNASGWNVVNDSGQSSQWQVVGGQYKQINSRVDAFYESYLLGSFAVYSNGAGLADYDARVTIYPSQNIAMSATDSVGLMFRYRDQNNYYRICVSRSQGFSRLEKRTNGVFRTLASDGRGFDMNQPIELLVCVKGPVILVYYNGEPRFAAEDTDHTSGTIALLTNGAAAFDDVMISASKLDSRVVLSEPGSYSIVTTESGGSSVFTSAFNTGADGFVYGDDAFGGTNAPGYASGGYVSGGGFSGGGLRVLLGGVDDSAVVGMSGGWSRPFSLSTQTLVRVSLRYRLVYQGTYEGDECGRALVSVDGVALSPDGTGVLRQYCGADPQTDVVLDSGWQQAIIEVSLAAGSHTVKVGGLNTKKTRANEYTEVYFDDIELADTGTGGGGSSRYKLSVRAVAMNLPPGAGVRFTLDKNTPGESRVTTHTRPFQADFLEVAAGDHALDALLVDAQSNPLTGDTSADGDTLVGVGGKYIVAFGDSITAGKGDDFDPDNDSFDGRNLGRGYAPVLNDLVTASVGLPVNVLNEGLGGTTSSHGALRLQSALERHPKSQIWLIQFGTNDAINGFRSGRGLQPGQSGYDGSFKDYMQQIVEGVSAAGKVPALAKIPVLLAACSDCTPYQDPSTEALNQLAQDYNTVIDELVAENHLLIQPPDFYSYFIENRSKFFDPLHPDGEGYQAMASLWAEKLIGSGELNP